LKKKGSWQALYWKRILGVPEERIDRPDGICPRVEVPAPFENYPGQQEAECLPELVAKKIASQDPSGTNLLFSWKSAAWIKTWGGKDR